MIFKIIFHSNCQNHQSFVPLICHKLPFWKNANPFNITKIIFVKLISRKKSFRFFFFDTSIKANKYILQCNMFVCWHLLNVYWKASNFFFKTCHKYFSGFRKLILIFLNCWFFVKSHGCQLTLIRRVAQTVGCVVLWKVTKNIWTFKYIG